MHSSYFKSPPDRFRRTLTVVLAAAMLVCASARATPPEPQTLDVPDLPPCSTEWASQIASMSGHRRSEVTSAWLTNGVRVHHLQLETSPGVVWVTVGFAGGELKETERDRGISLGACAAWDQLSVSGYPPAAIPSVLTDRDVKIDAVSGADAIQLRLVCARSDLEAGMSVVAALLRHPRVTETGLAATMSDGARQLRRRRMREDLIVADAIAVSLFPSGDARLLPPTQTKLDAVTADAAQRWLDQQIATAPVEASIVGDVSLDDAMRLAAGFLGRLAPRERISAAHLAPHRKLAQPAYPVRLELTRPIGAGEAIAVVGFPGADATRPSELRTMRVAARILDHRMTAALVSAGFANAEVSGVAIPSTVYPGFGVVIGNFTCEPERADQAADTMMKALATLAAGGARKNEVDSAAAELAQAVEQLEHSRDTWSGNILSRCDTAGVDLDEAAGGAEFYRSLTAEKVSAAIKGAYGDGRTLHLIITSDADR